MKKIKKCSFDGRVSEIELAYKYKTKACDRAKIGSSKEAAQLFRSNWNAGTMQLQEELKVLYLNRANHVLGIYTVCKGSMSGAVVDCKLILGAALLLAASHCVICHNHPSGNLQPSQADKLVTEKIKKCAALVDVNLLDHIIITADNYYSFAEEGLL